MPDVWGSIASVAGDNDRWDENIRQYVGDFAVAVLARAPANHADYNFDQLRPANQIGASQSVAFVAPTLGALEGDRIVAFECSVLDLAVDYLELVPFTAGSDDQKIRTADGSMVAIPAIMPTVDIELGVAAAGDDWAFYLVEIPLDLTGSMEPGWSIRTMERGDDGASSSLLVENFGEFRRVFVVAANVRRNDAGNLDQSQPWRLFASVVEPLVVSAVKISDGRNREIVWAVEREGQEDGGWNTRQIVTTGLSHTPNGTARIEVRLNRAALGQLQLTLGTLVVPLKPIGTGADEGSLFAADIALDALASELLTNDESSVELPIVVAGCDAYGTSFDMNPWTVPGLLAYGDDAELLRWEGDGLDGPGGLDNLGGLTVPFSKLGIPPHAMSVRLVQQQNGAGTVVYEAGWKQIEDLSLRRLDIALMGNYDPTLPAMIEVVFSQSMNERDLEVALEGVKAELARNTDREVEVTNARIAGGGELTASIEGTGYYYTGTLPAAPGLL
ncbi:MAG: hypothetical protein HOK83_17835 [Rhodospirillaceae bacterium]|nr:hypothetical protein [Rhodospirillaceae bacterium]